MLSIGPEAALPGSRKRPWYLPAKRISPEAAPRVCTGRITSRQPCKVLHESRNRGMVAVRFIRSADRMSGVKKLSRI